MEEKSLTPAPAAENAGTAEEPVFVNVTRMDRERYFEAVSSRGRSLRSRILTIGGAAVAVVALLMGSWFVSALGLLAAVLAVLSPGILGRRDFRKLCELHGGEEWTKTVRFYEDRVETDSGTGKISAAPYASIRRESETEHMYILEFGKELPATAFDKDSFVRGSVGELRPFLTEARRRVYDDPEK